MPGRDCAAEPHALRVAAASLLATWHNRRVTFVTCRDDIIPPIMRVTGGVTADQVRSELQSILASPGFVRSPRLGRLLTYLCEKALAGEAGQIKEYGIGVDVMDRPPSFDPTEDAIARVEVHRLRKRLREYYQKEGAADPVRIAVPVGQYAPEFLPAESGHGALSRGLPFGALSRGRLMLALGAGLCVLAVVAGTIVFVARQRAVPPAASAARVPRVAEAAAPGRASVFLACGQTRPHMDRLGRLWLADQYFEGGSTVEQPKRFIARAFDPRVFDFARAGDFSYHIPLAPGTYELRLYFVETVYGPGAPGGGGEISRVFDVLANGRALLTTLDIVSDAGDPFVADVRVFKNISPAADGKLHLQFRSRRELSRVSAIEIVPARPNKLNPVRMYFDDTVFTDSAGRSWMPAAYVSGGQTSRHTLHVSGTAAPELYSVERFGHFSFAIPVDTGTYTLSLHFAEEFVGPGNPAGAGGAGSRVFDVFCNGVALLRNFDVFKEAGGNNRALVKTFQGLRPNSQGKLNVDFVPVRDYASLYALEVTDDNR